MSDNPDTQKALIEMEEIDTSDYVPPENMETLPEVSIKCRSGNVKCASIRARLDNRTHEGVSYYQCVECNGSWVIQVGHRVII